jgi:S-adenosylmethionine hydrolase
VAIVYGHTRNERPPIVLKTKANKYYVAPDDGLISVVAAREGVDHVWVLHDEEKSDKVATESPIDSQGKDLFGTVAGMLSKGETLGNISDDLSPNKLASLSNREPTFIGNTITVQVVSVDRQGNIITNLSKDSEVAAKLKTDTLIKLSAKGQVFSGPLVVDFTDVPRERMALMYGPDKFLQIVQRQGSAARDMNLIPGDSLLLRL